MEGILMKLHIILASAAMLALAACGKSAPTVEASGDASAAATSEATPASAAPASAAPATAAAGGALTEAYVLGKWADVADGCKLSQEFMPGGKVNGLFDSWKIEGSNLVFGMMGENQSASVKIIDHDTMETQMTGGKPHTLKRC
jgi:hypothetical protein